VELAARQEVDVVLEALWTLAVCVQNFMLGSVNGPSSLVASMSVAAGLLEGPIDATVANGVCWGSRYGLAAAMLHFPELKTEQEVLGSGRISDLKEDEANAL
jgi:hypothetical protein